MPLYEYRCSGCHQSFETLLDRWDSPAPPCPQCGEARTERLLSVFAVPTASACEERSRPSPGGCGAGGCACRASSN
ncbi:MAG: zinc ribbon domain-containing protein [Candidatus Eisenbacteria bacterium]|nr:zinc ribbon domain-containing protein [Candidatus Eisenbacteria bacterium]